MFSSIGKLKYYDNPCKLIVEVDQGLSDYYRTLLPKWFIVNRQRYGAHITVIRSECEIPVHMEHWRKYDEQPIEFFYEPAVKWGKVYYWLNIFCVKLEDIRLELGLPVVSEWTLPPEGFVKCFHMTIGNCKGIS